MKKEIEMAKDIVVIQENEYNEILRQAVAVIENSRTILARQIAATASNTYWEIGKLLHEKKLALEGMTKPIGVADYQLIIPKEELQKTIAAEIKSFEEEKASKNQNDEA